MIWNAAESFDILVISLDILYNYLFNNSTKLFLNVCVCVCVCMCVCISS